MKTNPNQLNEYLWGCDLALIFKEKKASLDNSNVAGGEKHCLKASTSHGSQTIITWAFVEMQIIRLHPRPAASETLGVKLSNLCFNKPSRVILMLTQV